MNILRSGTYFGIILKIIIAALLSLHIGFVVSAEETPLENKNKYTIDDALAQAAATNREILQAEKDVAIAKAQLNQNVASLYVPQVSLSGSAGYSDAVTSQYETDSVDSGLPDNISTGISVSKSIFEGFRLSNTEKIGKMKLALARFAYADTVNGIALSVMVSFYKILLLRESLLLTELTDKNLKEHLDFAESGFELGKVTRLEVLQAKAAWNTNKPTLLKAGNDYELEKANICNLMGIEYRPDIDFSGDLAALSTITPAESDKEKIIALAIARDTALQSARNSIETAALNKSIQESACLPALSASFSYKFNFSPDPEYAGSKSFQPAWNIGIQFSMGLDDLLPFSQTQHAIREQAETKEKYELVYLARIKSLQYEIITLLNQLSEQQAAIASEQENAELALEELTLVKAEAEHGAYMPIDISDAELAYRNAVYKYKQAQYNYASLVWELDYRTGKEEK